MIERRFSKVHLMETNDPLFGIGCVKAADGTHRIYNSCPTSIAAAKESEVAADNVAVINLFVIGNEASVVTALLP